ncbi:hypothetical protein BamMC406_0915 [Burkholderia ambifaria MC40-6]|jgi:hypothetical protein|uniref:Uncharacterized protein n=1 Tax=Burkholderia ambifaria (strain MC40-6) TaxID=398577 RepID=B1YV23_BURA4|nr:hypothetical protein [Burkholderia ambifaria]ACB63406.1 hypothetical protein BamMC406_0915 [Burkholderia ambifaria MC40-6]
MQETLDSWVSWLGQVAPYAFLAVAACTVIAGFLSKRRLLISTWIDVHDTLAEIAQTRDNIASARQRILELPDNAPARAELLTRIEDQSARVAEQYAALQFAREQLWSLRKRYHVTDTQLKRRVGQHHHRLTPTDFVFEALANQDVQLTTPVSAQHGGAQ